MLKRFTKKITKRIFKTIIFLSGGKTGIARRLKWNEQCLTLTCSPIQKQIERCHPEEIRPLNIKEYSLIQSFPIKYKFYGSISSQYKQIGNAVPINLAKYVGKTIKLALLK